MHKRAFLASVCAWREKQMNMFQCHLSCPVSFIGWGAFNSQEGMFAFVLLQEKQLHLSQCYLSCRVSIIGWLSLKIHEDIFCFCLCFGREAYQYALVPLALSKCCNSLVIVFVASSCPAFLGHRLNAPQKGAP